MENNFRVGCSFSKINTKGLRPAGRRILKWITGNFVYNRTCGLWALTMRQKQQPSGTVISGR